MSDDRRRILRRFILDRAAPVEHHPDLRVAEMTVAEVLIDSGLRPRDDDQVTRHAASVRFVRRRRGSGEVCDHLAEQRTEEQEVHYVSLRSPGFFALQRSNRNVHSAS
jgi:hypothetical protein